MTNVYFKRIENKISTDEVNNITKQLLNKIIKDEKIKLNKEIPIKVHFGEKGNITYIKPQNYNGIIDYLKENNIKTSYIETNVVYKGERMTKDSHINLAKEHGFTQIPIIIADGDHGEAFDEIEINQKHFKTCKIGKEFKKYKQLLIISHFKGHILAGFGGAIKQLSMGFAARGGKLAMHSGSKPYINPISCKKCMICKTHCPVDAIEIKRFPKIHHDLCIGCAACTAVCPHDAIKLNIFKTTIAKSFYEKVAEYALAAVKDKSNIYMTFALNITKECDCMGKEMKPHIKDLGILASTDPVAIDKAVLDLLKKRENKDKIFRGEYTLDYAQKIGLGKKEYDLIEL